MVLAVLSVAANQDTPAAGPLRIIGLDNAGCIAGAVRLPEAGEGFQTIHLGRSSFWGAPVTIAGIEALGKQAHEAGLGDLYVEDIARPSGGPLPGGHVGHQLGLDADVGLDTTPKHALSATERETVELPSLVRADQRGVDTTRWTPGAVTLLRLAAGLPNVDRILVNPAIKKQLCDAVQGDRSWLRMIRPWYDHMAHMHIHFRCPPGQHDCVDIPPQPAGDSCDATLQWWFDQLNAPPQPAKPYHLPSLPAACKAVMEER
jgi:penicillin-insensitive murein DD-endopeptidase